MKKILLLFVLVMSCAASELKLSDGQVFRDWSVIGQTDDTVTIKHSKGGTKISKSLLPVDILENYPVVKPVTREPIPLPPEDDRLEKSRAKERWFSTEDPQNPGTTLTWTLVAIDCDSLAVIRRSKKIDSDQTHQDYSFVIHQDEIPAVVNALQKAQSWAMSVFRDHPPSFEKSIGTVIDSEWKFDWDRRVVIRTGLYGANQLDAMDTAGIPLVLGSARHVLAELNRERETAENYAASLK